MNIIASNEIYGKLKIYASKTRTTLIHAVKPTYKMIAKEFKKSWNEAKDYLHLINISNIYNLEPSHPTIAYFAFAGLPNECAPFLSCVIDSNDMYKGINRLTGATDLLISEI